MLDADPRLMSVVYVSAAEETCHVYALPRGSNATRSLSPGSVTNEGRRSQRVLDRPLSPTGTGQIALAGAL